MANKQSIVCIIKTDAQFLCIRFSFLWELELRGRKGNNS